MTSEPGPEPPPRNEPPEDDDAADTQAWQAFLEGSSEPERPKAVGAPFRILTLLAGLAVFVLVVLLLLR